MTLAYITKRLSEEEKKEHDLVGGQTALLIYSEGRGLRTSDPLPFPALSSRVRLLDQPSPALGHRLPSPAASYRLPPPSPPRPPTIGFRRLRHLARPWALTTDFHRLPLPCAPLGRDSNLEQEVFNAEGDEAVNRLEFGHSSSEDEVVSSFIRRRETRALAFLGEAYSSHRAVRAQASPGETATRQFTTPVYVHHHHHHHHLTQRTVTKATLELENLSTYSKALIELHHEVLKGRQELLAQRSREPGWFHVGILRFLVLAHIAVFFHLYNQTSMY